MRNFERQADIFVYEFQDNAGPLISSLKKIVTISGQPPEKPNWHHFSIRERIDYLRRCDADRSWVGRHHRKIRGLMTIPPLYNEPDRVAPYFRMLRELRDRVSGEDIPHVNMDELSMGMTGDFETAISEGATLIRIGTAIFGQRQ